MSHLVAPGRRLFLAGEMMECPCGRAIAKTRVPQTTERADPAQPIGDWEYKCRSCRALVAITAIRAPTST